MLTRRGTLAALFLVGTASMAWAGDDTTAIDDMPHITIVGTARTEVTPDLAILTLGIVTDQPTAKAAAEANAKTAQAVVAAAKADGIAAPDIATQSVTLIQLYDEAPNGDSSGRRPRGFEASNTIAVRVRDLSKVGAVTEDLIQKGANQFNGIAFTVAHPEPILDKLSAEAVTNAKQVAEISARAAGVHLGRVLLIERPGADGGPAPVAFGMARVRAAPPVPIESGTTELSAQMQVTWEIVPN